MAKSPAEILRKTKSPEKKNDKDSDDKDNKPPRRNAILDFIAKNKKTTN